MKVIQHTLRESVLAGLIFPFINWGIVALTFAICNALGIGSNPDVLSAVFKPGLALLCIGTGVAAGVVYASAIGSRVEIGNDRISIHRRNGDEESAELTAIQSWRYDSRQRRTLIRLHDGHELKLPWLAPIKVWIIKSTVKAEFARMQTKIDGAG
ncbi:MAG TPA: hypothetical protein VIM57_05980 [Luteolibacter sp.]